MAMQFGFKPNFERLHVSLNDHHMLIEHLRGKVSCFKKQQGELSAKAEQFKFESLCLDKVNFAPFVQNYLLQKLSLKDLKSIELILKYCSSQEFATPAGKIQIDSMFLDDPCYYLKAAKEGDTTKIKQSFKEDSASLEEDYHNTRKQAIQVKPSFDACTKRVTNKLA